MIVLGMDTATASTAVALRLDDGSTAEARHDPAPGEHPGHATRLLPMVHELLARAGLSWGELDRIAVGLGPGTFTGLRVGVATARGLAQSLGAELAGVPSTEALALPALSGPATGGADAAEDAHGPVLSVIDARRGEVFAAAYVTGPDARPSQALEPSAVRPADLGGVLQAGEAGVLETGAGWLAVGDGAVRYREHLEPLGVSVPSDGSPLHLISAAAVCELGGGSQPSPMTPLPDYRRRPDAELSLQGAGTRGMARG